MDELRLIARGVDALERIAAAIEMLTVGLADPQPSELPCQHPPDARIDFGVTNGVEDWQCRACGFRTMPTLVGQA